MTGPDSSLRAKQVDERDNAWEDPRPRFRVYFHASSASATQGTTDTYDVTGADVVQVIDWAQRRAGDHSTYAVALVRDDAGAARGTPGRRRGLVWLVGMDGNDDTGDDVVGRDVQRRMLLRRGSPVGVPEADRAPGEVGDPHEGST